MFPYAAETFSADEEDILRRYVTNLDQPVFALVNLPEVVKGALFARYSRSPKSLRRLFLDEFVGDLDVSGDASIDAQLARDQTEAGRRNAVAARAAIPSAAHKEAAWSVLTSGTLGPESVRLTAHAFMLPEHASLLAPYADAYIPTLADIWDRRDEHLRALLGMLLFPYPVVSPGLLASLDSFASERSADPGLTRLLTELRDAGSRALRSRELRIGA